MDLLVCTHVQPRLRAAGLWGFSLNDTAALRSPSLCGQIPLPTRHCQWLHSSPWSEYWLLTAAVTKCWGHSDQDNRNVLSHGSGSWCRQGWLFLKEVRRSHAPLLASGGLLAVLWFLGLSKRHPGLCLHLHVDNPPPPTQPHALVSHFPFR